LVNNITMAQIHEEIIAIRFSRLIRKGEDPTAIVNEDILTTLETAAQELAGDGVIVEVIENSEE
jgi:pyruvate/2-oxoglutarate/acetoin dehydrogenase E1 component